MEGKGSKRGHWSIEEDKILMAYISIHGKGRWNRLAKATGLKRCGKSCRLRWMNYLSPNIKKGSFSEEENDLIIRLHKLLGNRWSWIAGRVPGRTDNQVKNHWNTHLSKILKDGKIRVNKKDFLLPVPSSQESSSQAAEEEMEPNACREDVAQNQSVSEGEAQSGLNGCTSEEEIILQQQEQQLSSTNDQLFSNMSGDCSLSSLWVVNNEQSLDDAPSYSLVELFEGFPLDMMWNHDF